MILIAICDSDGERSYQIVSKYLKSLHTPYRIFCFHKKEEFSNVTVRPNLLIFRATEDLEGDIKYLNAIRERNKHIAFIIIGSDLSPIYSYVNRVHPFAYLLKSEIELELREQLEALGRHINLEKRPSQSIRLKTLRASSGEDLKYKYTTFDTHDILYFEVVHRRIKICLEHEEYYFVDRLKNLVDLLKGSSFELCHQGCLVNLEHIERIEGYTIYLHSGREIYMSQKKARTFKKRLSDYMEHKSKLSIMY